MYTYSTQDGTNIYKFRRSTTLAALATFKPAFLPHLQIN